MRLIRPVAWLKVRDVAEILNLSEWAVREAIRRGEIPHKRIGRSIRIPPTAVGLPMEREEEFRLPTQAEANEELRRLLEDEFPA